MKPVHGQAQQPLSNVFDDVLLIGSDLIAIFVGTIGEIAVGGSPGNCSDHYFLVAGLGVP